MSKCIWILDETNGDLVLVVNDKEKGRISAGEALRLEKKQSVSSINALEQLKEQLEKEFQC
jgi:hypothetical protein